MESGFGRSAPAANRRIPGRRASITALFARRGRRFPIPPTLRPLRPASFPFPMGMATRGFTRFQRLGKELEIKNIVAVANKVKNKEDEDAIKEFCAQTDLPVIAVIPFDSIISEADKGGSLDMSAINHSPALQAINQLATDLLGKVIA